MEADLKTAFQTGIRSDSGILSGCSVRLRRELSFSESIEPDFTADRVKPAIF